MSLTRRLAAGLPVAGITALAALAFSGAPAAATGDETSRVAHPVVMTTPSADGYGDGDEAPTRGHDGYGYGGESPTTTPPTTTPPTTAPTTTPPTPTASVDTVPPGGESPAVSPSVSTAAVSPSPSESTPPGGGVSAGGTLPLTGAPMGMTLALGAALVAAGAGAVFYSRRKRA